MNKFQRKITLRVFGVHAAIIFLMIFIPFVRGCFKPRPKEIVTFIEFGAPAPQVDLVPVNRLPEPPAPAPEPEPAPIPEPKQVMPEPKPKPKPEPKPKEPEKKPEPKPQEPEKPKWKATRPEDIIKGKKIEPKPTRPAVSHTDIEKALSGIASGATQDPGRFNDYYARIMRLFYEQWTPPAAATSATGSAVVRIHMLKNGQITKRAKIKGSGDPLYDRTVMEAVNRVSTLPKPPADYPYDYVEVIFTLDN
jgi:protein TonB